MQRRTCVICRLLILITLVDTVLDWRRSKLSNQSLEFGCRKRIVSRPMPADCNRDVDHVAFFLSCSINIGHMFASSVFHKACTDCFSRVFDSGCSYFSDRNVLFMSRLSDLLFVLRFSSSCVIVCALSRVSRASCVLYCYLY